MTKKTGMTAQKLRKTELVTQVVIKHYRTSHATLQERDRAQGRQMTIHAIENGVESGGSGAVHTESVLGYYLTWGADLHVLLADAALAVCIILMAGNRQVPLSLSDRSNN